jgi:hypothetical protein
MTPFIMFCNQTSATLIIPLSPKIVERRKNNPAANPFKEEKTGEEFGLKYC